MLVKGALGVIRFSTNTVKHSSITKCCWYQWGQVINIPWCPSEINSTIMCCELSIEVWLLIQSEILTEKSITVQQNCQLQKTSNCVLLIVETFLISHTTRWPATSWLMHNCGIFNALTIQIEQFCMNLMTMLCTYNYNTKLQQTTACMSIHKLILTMQELVVKLHNFNLLIELFIFHWQFSRAKGNTKTLFKYKDHLSRYQNSHNKEILY